MIASTTEMFDTKENSYRHDSMVDATTTVVVFVLHD